MAQPQFDENGMLVGIVEGEQSPEATPAPAPAAPQVAAVATQQTDPEATAVPEVSVPAPEGVEEGNDERRGLGFYAGEAVKAVGGGIRDAAQEIGETAQWAGETLGTAIKGDKDIYYTGEDGFEWLTDDEVRMRDDVPEWQTRDLFGDEGTIDLPDVPENETMVGGVSRGVVQFVAGYGAVTRSLGLAARAGKGAQAAQAAGQGAVTDFITFDAHEDRMSDLLRDNLGLNDAVTAYLQADPEDTVFEGKFKNSLEGLGLGVATDAGFRVSEAVFRLVKSFKKAKAVEVEKGPDAAAEVMHEEMVKLADDGQLDLFDAASDPNIRSDTAERKVVGGKDEGKAEAEPEAVAPKEAAAENLLRTAPSEPRPDLDTKALNDYLSAEVQMRNEGLYPDPNRAPLDSPFNLDKLMGDVDVMDILTKAVDATDTSVVPDSTTLAKITADGKAFLADTLDVDPFKLDRTLQQYAKASEDMPKVIQAGKTLMTSLSAEVDRLAEVIGTGGGTPAVLNRFMRMQARLADVATNLKATTKGAAQTTSSGRIEQTNWLTGDALSEADTLAQIRENIAKGGGTEEIEKLAQLVRDNRRAKGGVKGVVAISSKANGGFRKFIEYYINSILSGPKTHVINIASNGLNAAILPAEKMLGGVMARDRSLITEGLRQYQGMAIVFRDAMKMGGVAFAKGRNLLDPEAAILEANGVDYRAIKSDSKNPLVRNTINGLGTVIRLPSRALLSSDEFFKQLNYRSSVYARLMGDAAVMIDNGKLKRADAGKWVADRMQASVSKEGTARSQQGIDYAREATFTQDLRQGSFSKWVQDGTNKYPAMKLVLPFVRTPTNILKAGVQRTPLIRKLSHQTKADLASGDPRRIAQANGKLVTGNAVAGSAMMLAINGNITGSGPKDPAARARLLETGWRPYSVRMGDRFVSYQRVDPYAMFFGVIADIAEVGGEVDEATLGDLGSAAVIGLVNNIGSKTYLTGLTDMITALDDPERYGQQMLNNYASAMVPMSAFQRELRRNGDPYMREVRSAVDAVRNTVVGLSDDLPARRSWITGKPIVYPVGWGADMVSPVGDAFASMNPILQGKDLNDKALDELASLNNGFSAPTRKVNGIELTSKQYARFNELHGTIKLRGRTLHEQLGSTIDSARYQSFSKTASDPATDPRVKTLQSVIASYREAAKFELLKENPELLDKIKAKQSELAENARGSNNPAPVSYSDLIGVGQ